MSEQLGRYTLEKRIAAGGMAEVFLATDANGKRCVIKRMLPNLLVDKHFSQMFLDEAKLVVQLNHPVIAQVTDFGQDKGVLYLAMEYVEGVNLRMIVKDFAGRGQKIPIECCARLVSQAALALGYAHRAAGIDGKLLKIIHRDVSPHNILLSNAGEVKLIDFGVAKATSAGQQTAAGMIKGKFAYMSPEQLRGHTLDGRSDIYGLGLVLYELLAAERAIGGSSDAEIAYNALNLKLVPIEKKRPEVPPALRAILAHALHPERAQRYPNAEQMATELETFIIPRMPKLSAHELAALLPQPGPVSTPRASPPAAASASGPAQIGPVPGFWAANAANAPTTQVPTRESAPRRTVIDTPSPVARGAVATEPAGRGAAFWNASPVESAAQATVLNPPGLRPKGVGALSEPTQPAGVPLVATATVRTDLGARSGRGALKWFLPALVVGFLAAGVGWKLASPHRAAPQPTSAPPPVAVAATPVPAPGPTTPTTPPPPSLAVAVAPPGTPEPPPSARLSLTSSVNARVSLDGRPAGRTPVELIIPPGPHQLLFEDLGSDTRQLQRLELKAGEARVDAWKPEPGRVVVRAVPWAEVFVGGVSKGVTPLEPIVLLSGSHTLTFVNSETNRRDERTVIVAPNAETMVKVDLRSDP